MSEDETDGCETNFWGIATSGITGLARDSMRVADVALRDMTNQGVLGPAAPRQRSRQSLARTPRGSAAIATAPVQHQPPATDTGLSVTHGPEGYPSPPSSVWSRSVSAVSWA